MNRRHALTALITSAIGSGAAAPWPNAVFSMEGAQTTKEPFGEVTVFQEGKTGMLRDMTAGTCLLYPGQEPHPPHRHPEEEFMLVTDGAGEILVNGQEHRVANGSLMYCEGNATHGIRNTGSAPMRFYYFKWRA